MSANVELTGVARLYRAASSDRRERGRAQGYASAAANLNDFDGGCFLAAANSETAGKARTLRGWIGVGRTHLMIIDFASSASENELASNVLVCEDSFSLRGTSPRKRQRTTFVP